MIAIHQNPMQTLALLARKGGAGKTTLALHLAVLAQASGCRVLLVDCDPQRSAAGWWRARAADTPELAEVDAAHLGAVLIAAQEDGVTLAIVDTRPSVETDAVEAAKLADLVLIPARPSILDLRAIGATVELVKATGAEAALVLNACPPPRGAGEASVTSEARRGLVAYGLPIAPVSVTQRAALAYALIDGRAVTEFDPDGKAAAEMRGLWRWTEEQLWPSAQR